MPKAAPDDPVVKLALEQLALVRRVDDQERVIGDTVEKVTKVLEILGEQDPAYLMSPWWWPRLKRDEARRSWAILTRWVDEVIIPTYDQKEGEAKPPALAEGVHLKQCWFAHNDVRQRLAALYWSWMGNYKRNAPINGAIEW